MSKTTLVFSTFCLLCSLTGCAQFTHYNKERQLTNGAAVFIDAKQRGVYQVRKTITDNATPPNTTVWDGICAEPSPDALSALAASLGLNLSLNDNEQLALSQSISEATGTLGIRTVAIQALRDIMYRNCEAYALGGVSEIGIETLQRRFQSTMVAIIAIEQLTGAVRAPSITLSGSSRVGAAEEILELTNKAEAARKELAAAISAEDKAKEASDTISKSVIETETKLKTMENELASINEKQAAGTELTPAETQTLADHTELTKTLDEQKKEERTLKSALETARDSKSAKDEAYQAVEASRIAVLAGTGAATTTAQLENLQQTSPLSDTAVEKLATAVKEIVVQATSGLRFSDELCITLIGQYGNVKAEEDSALFICNSRLQRGQLNAI